MLAYTFILPSELAGFSVWHIPVTFNHVRMNYNFIALGSIEAVKMSTHSIYTWFHFLSPFLSKFNVLNMVKDSTGGVLATPFLNILDMLKG